MNTEEDPSKFGFTIKQVGLLLGVVTMAGSVFVYGWNSWVSWNTFRTDTKHTMELHAREHATKSEVWKQKADLRTEMKAWVKEGYPVPQAVINKQLSDMAITLADLRARLRVLEKAP